MRKKGFTLIELMVVVLIVAILAAVIIPIMRGRLDSAKWSEGRAMMGSIATSIRAFAAEKGPGWTGTFPTTVAGYGFASGDLTGKYFEDDDFGISGVSYNSSSGILQYTIAATPDASGTNNFAPTAPTTLSLTEAGFSDGAGS